MSGNDLVHVLFTNGCINPSVLVATWRQVKRFHAAAIYRSLTGTNGLF